MSTAVVMGSLVGIVLFTIIIVPFTLRNPLVSVGDYPPAIREKCIELGLIEKRDQRFTRTDFIRSSIGMMHLFLTVSGSVIAGESGYQARKA